MDVGAAAVRREGYALDLDFTRLLHEDGHQEGVHTGYKRTGFKPCLHPLLAVIAEARLVAQLRLRSGNAACASNAVAHFRPELAREHTATGGLANYNGRADCENVITGLQQGFALPTLCLESFWATEEEALATLTYKLSVLFQRHLGWQTKGPIHSLRCWLFRSPALFTYPTGKTILKLTVPQRERDWWTWLWEKILSPFPNCNAVEQRPVSRLICSPITSFRTPDGRQGLRCERVRAHRQALLLARHFHRAQRGARLDPVETLS